MTTWRDKQAAQQDAIEMAVKSWTLNAGHPDYERMEMAIETYETVTEINQQCDEPGCERIAGCGYPVPDGYRRTCHEHIDKDAP
jgi:hypothetical protein